MNETNRTGLLNDDEHINLIAAEADADGQLLEDQCQQMSATDAPENSEEERQTSVCPAPKSNPDKGTSQSRIPRHVLSRTSLALSILSKLAAAVAIVSLLNGSVFATDAPLHFLVDDSIKASAGLFPDSLPIRSLRYEHLEHQVMSSCQSVRNAGQSDESLFAEISRELELHPQDLKFRQLRSQLCGICHSYMYDQEKLLIGCRDAQLLAQKRGSADDWAGLAIFQSRSGSDEWRASLKQARKLGYRFPKELAVGTCDWVLATLRDCRYSYPHMLSWLEGMGEITGDHSLDYLIAKIYQNSGQYQKAIEVYSKMIKEGTDKESVSYPYLMRGACQKWLGKDKLARADFQESLKHIANDPRLAVFEATAKGALGNTNDQYVLGESDPDAKMLYYVLSEQYDKVLSLDRVYSINSLGVEKLCEYSPRFLDQEANMHLMRALSFEKLNNAKEAAAERKLALESIPEPVRKELRI